MMRLTLMVGACLVGLLARPVSAASVVEDFGSDPAARWGLGIGDNSHGQFVWNAAAAPAWTGDATGALAVHLDSSLPTARFDRPLGVTVGGGDDFTLTTRFRFHVTAAPSDQFMQMAFGLANRSLTGGDRTGSLADFTSDNVFHTVEFTYFPNVSSFGGPTLSPAAFGARKNGQDAFANFGSIFGSGSDLGDNATGVKTLPADTTLEARLDYAAASRTLTLAMSQVAANGSLTPINTELPALVLALPGYDPALPFLVDTLSIMAYHDGFTSAAAPSLVADLVFERLEFSTPVPEPGAAALAALAALGAVVASRRFARKAR